MGSQIESANIRKDYTGYEKDNESGLEFAQNRYYNSSHGRFTSVDPLTPSATIKNPQTFNRYSYVTNSPYKFTDPLGLMQADASQGWNNVAPGFWGTDLNGGRQSPGQQIISAADALYDRATFKNQSDASLANHLLRRGQTQQAQAIVDANDNLEKVEARQARTEVTVTVVGEEESGTGSATPDDNEPGNEDVGITIVVWDNVLGFSTRVLGHLSYIIDDTSYSFDATDYHPETIGEYFNKSLQISGATLYMLDFGSKALNDRFKELIKGEYKGVLSYYTGSNNCSSAFQRSINAMRKDLGTWTVRNTPRGVGAFINGSLSKYLTGQYRMEKR